MTLLEPREIPPLFGLGRVHFIAIGGAGMSGVAQGYITRGFLVSGSDQVDSEALRVLSEQGASVWVGHDPKHVAGADTVVVSSAIRDDNVELVEARQRGIPVIHRSLALASLMQGYQVVSVAGTHGKTTTTAMVVAGLQGAGHDPSYVIGGTLLTTGMNAYISQGQQFVIEADESDGSFRQYPTNIAVITGIETDHLDNWGTPERYAQGFQEFATGSTVSTVILCADDPGGQALARTLVRQGRRVMTYGSSDGSDLRLSDIRAISGTAVVTYGNWSLPIRVGVRGVHNLHNAAAALCVGEVLGVDRGGFLAGLATFGGTARRFQYLGLAREIRVVDDYAHHPTEVAATIATARLSAGVGRVIVCFQPHLYSRTQHFADEFGAALAAADEVVVLDVYPAREDPILGVTGELVARAVAARGVRVHYVPREEDAVEALVPLAKPGDLVLTVGAGSVTAIGPQLLERLAP